MPGMKQGSVEPLEAFGSEIDTVIFDIGNVLIDFAWEEYLDGFHYDEKTREAVADAMFRNEDWNAGDSGLVTTEEWLELFLENAPEYDREIREVFAGFGASIVPYAFTRPWIQSLKEQGVKLYFLSNYSAEMYRQSEEQLSFLREFDGGIFSWKEKCMKLLLEFIRRCLNGTGSPQSVQCSSTTGRKM